MATRNPNRRPALTPTQSRVIREMGIRNSATIEAKDMPKGHGMKKTIGILVANGWLIETTTGDGHMAYRVAEPRG